MFEKVDYVMVMVSNMKKSIEFYRDQLGLRLKFDSPDWTEFETEGTTLALHGGGKTKSAANKESNDAGTCSIGFNVANLDTAYEELKSKGVRFVMPPTDREGEGIKLAVAVDPDGLPISFSEAKKK